MNANEHLPTVSTEEVEEWFDDEEGEASSPAAQER
jgi:hypothetical protein